MLGDRLKELIREKKCTLTEIAKACGTSITTVRRWLNDEVGQIGSRYILNLAEFFDVNIAWIETGEGPKRGTNIVAMPYDEEGLSKEFVKIYESKVVFACGAGCEPTFEEVHDGNSAVYRLDFFQKKHLKPKCCARFKVQGDSMAPFIMDGDYVLVDLSDNKEILPNKIYAIGVQGSMRVKRLLRKITGELEIKSDNPNYSIEILSPEDADQFVTIIGRVIDRSGCDGF